MSNGDRFNWLEFGRALAGIIVIAGLMASSILAVYNEGDGPAMLVMLFYASLALVLFGLKEGLDLFGGGGGSGGGGSAGGGRTGNNANTNGTDDNGGRN